MYKKKSPFDSCCGSSLIISLSASRWRYRDSQEITKGVRTQHRENSTSVLNVTQYTQVQVTTVLIRLHRLDTRTSSIGKFSLL